RVRLRHLDPVLGQHLANELDVGGIGSVLVGHLLRTQRVRAEDKLRGQRGPAPGYQRHLDTGRAVNWAGWLKPRNGAAFAAGQWHEGIVCHDLAPWVNGVTSAQVPAPQVRSTGLRSVGASTGCSHHRTSAPRGRRGPRSGSGRQYRVLAGQGEVNAPGGPGAAIWRRLENGRKGRAAWPVPSVASPVGCAAVRRRSARWARRWPRRTR